MAIRLTCGECGYHGTYKSQPLAEHHFGRHSCRRERAKQAARRKARAARARRAAAIDRTPKPCLHKIARHEHGTHACYVLDRCKCRPCAAANSNYEKQRAKRRAYGYQAYVDAQPTREHVLALRAAGMGLKQVAKVSGVPHGGVAKLIYGDPVRGLAPSKRIRWETAVKLQVVRVDISTLAGGAFVDAIGTQRRAQSLVALGWSQSQISARIGMERGNWSGVMRRDQVSARTARAVADLYRELWDRPPPERTHREKISASRARNDAATRGWPPPLAWADVDIDDPAAHPNTTGYDPERVDAVMAGALLAGDEDLELSLTRVDRLEVLRRGRAAFAWHNTAQIAARVGLTATQLYSDIAKDQRPAKYEHSGELDEILVDRIARGETRVPLNAQSPELVEAIRRLDQLGLSDAAIGDRVGRTGTAVNKLRIHHNINTGAPVSKSASTRKGTAQQIDGIAARSDSSEAVTPLDLESLLPA